MTSPSQLFEGHRLESNGQIAPEYDGVKVDTWAVGITLHILLRGNYPFDGLPEGLALTASGDLSKTLIRKLKSSVTVSPDCLDFITRCLTFDATARPTVHELLAHKWLEGCNDPVRFALLCRVHTSRAHALATAAQAAGSAVVDPAVLQHVDDIITRIKQGLP